MKGIAMMGWGLLALYLIVVAVDRLFPPRRGKVR